jgi:hypothetical protein
MAAPNIDDITPNIGLPNTATAVTITGTGFTGVTDVTFGGEDASNVVEVSDTEITCDTPLIAYLATVDVIVMTPEGENTMYGGFTFEEPATPPGGPGTEAFFPAFTPIIPPPPVGDPVGVPPFPPPTPPPMGHVPVGPLVGPAVDTAGVPPSVAGYPQPRFQPPGSATVPTAASLFPSFTTTSPSPPIVFANIWNGATETGGVWDDNTPPSTPTTRNIILNGWGLPGPQTTPPQVVTPPGGFNSEQADAYAVRGGHAEPAQRSARSILPDADAEDLHQSVAPSHRRSKRVSARDPARRPNNP